MACALARVERRRARGQATHGHSGRICWSCSCRPIVNVAGTTGPLPTPRNGPFVFTIETDEPAPLPPTPTCPNEMGTATIVDVAVTTATLTLLEDGVVSDTVTVPVTQVEANAEPLCRGRAKPA
jgi:hypothetical protein